MIKEYAIKSDLSFLESLTDHTNIPISALAFSVAGIYRHRKVGSTMVADYEAKWKNCIVRSDKKASIAKYVALAKKQSNHYTELGIPWEVVAVTHMKEAGFRLNGHLHNGDPLTGRTIHVPKGRIPDKKPPYIFLQSALDAIIYHANSLGIDLTRYKWDVANTLFWLETFNGMGYRNRGLNSPYLWSYSNLYSKGLYVADGKFSPNAVSKSPGAAVVLKALGWKPA